MLYLFIIKKVLELGAQKTQHHGQIDKSNPEIASMKISEENVSLFKKLIFCLSPILDRIKRLENLEIS